MMGFHLQGNVDDWPTAVAKLPKGAPVKMVDGVQRCAEAKRANTGIWTNVRHHVHEQNPTGDMHQQARAFFASFVDESFRKEAWAVDSVGEYNEYFSDSQTVEERARWVKWIQACVDVWRDEYRTQDDYAHIDLTLAATAVGNNIPLAVAKIAHENPFCILDYHAYTPVYQDTIHPEHWQWYDGRFESMDKIFRYNGYTVRWFFGEAGAVGLTGPGWPNSLAPNDGWRHFDVYNGDLDGYLDMMTEWASCLEETAAWQAGRVIGAVLFTSGGGSQWKHFEVKQPEMSIIADHIYQLRETMIDPDDPDPPPPPPPEKECQGEPREQYRRLVHVVPQTVSLNDYIEVASEAYLQKQTVGFSHDDAGIGALDYKTAVLWGIAPEQQETYQTWYGRWYPGTSIQFENFIPDNPPIVDVNKWVDVSHHQGEINWKQMKEHGVTHCYIRCTYGISNPDSYVIDNVHGAQERGIVFGLYHYFLNHQSALSQAKYFLNNAPGGMLGDLPPVIDIERTLQSAPLYPGDVQIWLDHVEAQTGTKPVIYTSKAGWNEQILTYQPWANNYALWVANYTTAEQPVLPRDWSTWWLWQYGKERGAPYGVSNSAIDVNRPNETTF